MLTISNKKDISSLFASISKDEEFEIMFNNYRSDNQLSLIDFMNVVKYVKYISDKDTLKLSESVSLDVFYLDYRISIDGLENINNIMGLLYQRKNNNIFSIIVSQYLDKEGFKLIQKIKEKSNTIDIDNLDIRVRKSKELDVKNEDIIKNLSKISALEADKINFRYKQRMSLELSEELHVDMTIVKSSDNISSISNAIKNYEIEIDYSICSSDKKCNPDKKVLEQMFEEVEKIKKVMNNSDILINKEEEKEIIEKYVNTLYGISFEGANILYSMQPISAEVQHIVDNIPNKYSATDKTDGDKYQLYVYKDECYLISNNLHVKKMGVKNKELNNTIIEGELIYIDEKRIYLFMMFDCLYYKGTDIRIEPLYKSRIKYVEDTLNCFQNGSIYKIKEFKLSNEFNIKEQEKHYSTGIYSILHNKWLINPTKDSKIDNPNLIKKKSSEYMNLIDGLDSIYDKGHYNYLIRKIDRIKDKIKKMRQSGLEDKGEFSNENLIFKVLRRTGYIEKLFDLQTKSYDRAFSL
jgi:hypothetical protein